MEVAGRRPALLSCKHLQLLSLALMNEDQDKVTKIITVNPGISTLLFFWSTYSSEDGESLAIAPSE